LRLGDFRAAAAVGKNWRHCGFLTVERNGRDPAQTHDTWNLGLITFKKRTRFGYILTRCTYFGGAGAEGDLVRGPRCPVRKKIPPHPERQISKFLDGEKYS
jgi:hypothetical protein